jgi:hypothetical protein
MDFLLCKEKHLHFQALQMWANYLETGDPIMSADTAVKCGQQEDVRVLSDDQKRLVLRLRYEAGLTLQHGLAARPHPEDFTIHFPIKRESSL